MPPAVQDISYLRRVARYHTPGRWHTRQVNVLLTFLHDYLLIISEHKSVRYKYYGGEPFLNGLIVLFQL